MDGQNNLQKIRAWTLKINTIQFTDFPCILWFISLMHSSKMLLKIDTFSTEGDNVISIWLFDHMKGKIT